MSLADGLAWALRARALSVAQVAERCTHDRSMIYRIVRGDVADVRTDTLLDLCRTVRVDPTVLLRRSGLWPPSVPPADEMDSALLRLLPRLEALPPDHKRWALAVVQALLASAPAARLPMAMGDEDASSSQEGQTSCVIAENVLG